MKKGCARKIHGGDLCPIVIEQAVRITRLEATEKKAASMAARRATANAELTRRVAELEKAICILVREEAILTNDDLDLECDEPDAQAIAWFLIEAEKNSAY